MSEINIREITLEDDKAISAVIRAVLIEFGVPKVGTAYEDEALDCMFETYDTNRSAYFVIVADSKIIGGAGIAPLANFEGNTCELQKMYFLPEARGKGLGSQMMNQCLVKAKAFGYEQCYLETMPYMDAARSLYRKSGFKDLEAPLGNTGHYSCSKWMLKTLL